MNQSDKNDNFQTQLLQQESTLLQHQYQEHRMQLEVRLAQAERYKKIAKVTGFISILLAAGLFPIVASRSLGSADPFDKDATLLSVSLMVLYILTCAVGAISIAMFYSRLLPRTRQVREDLRDEMVREMRNEIAELREQVNRLIQAGRQ
ncbi:MAG: hypothetical protein JNL58_14965 [Planctomyces sp.]|nr:hypothetical protein [Planctomyces sp.]